MGKRFNKVLELNTFLVVIIVVCVGVIAVWLGFVITDAINEGQRQQELEQRRQEWELEREQACRVDGEGELVEPRRCEMYNAPVFTPALEKPVIYLYPKSKQGVEVKLDFDGEVLASWPEYLNGGWKVEAYPDGRLVQNGREYSYLFWEGRSNVEIKYDLTTGFVVRGSEVREFLREKLAEMGLTPKECNEFIVYWYPKMQKNEWNLVHFASFDEYDKYARLDIDPKPDAMLRVFMTYKGIDAPMPVMPQEFDGFERKGFTVVEWGGSELR